MAKTHKKFRELVAPDSNFEFVGRAKVWGIVSFLLVSASIGLLFVNKSVRGNHLNWGIDFKGGTEIIWEFRDKESQETVRKEAGEVRGALQSAGFKGIAVSDMTWDRDKDGKTVTVAGMMTRTPLFGAIADEAAESLRKEFMAAFEAENMVARWAGDQLRVRSKRFIKWDEANEFFTKHNHELRAWEKEDAKAFSAPQRGHRRIQHVVSHCWSRCSV